MFNCSQIAAGILCDRLWERAVAEEGWIHASSVLPSEYMVAIHVSTDVKSRWAAGKALNIVESIWWKYSVFCYSKTLRCIFNYELFEEWHSHLIHIDLLCPLYYWSLITGIWPIFFETGSFSTAWDSGMHVECLISKSQWFTCLHPFSSRIPNPSSSRSIFIWALVLKMGSLCLRDHYFTISQALILTIVVQIWKSRCSKQQQECLVFTKSVE